MNPTLRGTSIVRRTSVVRIFLATVGMYFLVSRLERQPSGGPLCNWPQYSGYRFPPAREVEVLHRAQNDATRLIFTVTYVVKKRTQETKEAAICCPNSRAQLTAPVVVGRGAMKGGISIDLFPAPSRVDGRSACPSSKVDHLYHSVAQGQICLPDERVCVLLCVCFVLRGGGRGGRARWCMKRVIHHL